MLALTMRVAHLDGLTCGLDGRPNPFAEAHCTQVRSVKTVGPGKSVLTRKVTREPTVFLVASRCQVSTTYLAMRTLSILHDIIYSKQLRVTSRA